MKGIMTHNDSNHNTKRARSKSAFKELMKMFSIESYKN